LLPTSFKVRASWTTSSPFSPSKTRCSRRPEALRGEHFLQAPVGVPCVLRRHGRWLRSARDGAQALELALDVEVALGLDRAYQVFARVLLGEFHVNVFAVAGAAQQMRERVRRRNGTRGTWARRFEAHERRWRAGRWAQRRACRRGWLGDGQARGLDGELLPRRLDRKPGNALQCLENADAVERRRLEPREALRVQRLVELLDRVDVADIALVVLHHERDPLDAEAHLGQVGREVRKRLEVRLQRLDLAVGHEHDAVDALQDQLAGGVVEDLTGHGVELQAHLHAADHAHIDRQQVEKQRAVRLGFQADHLAARLRRRLLVDELEVGRLPAQARAVVDDLGRHLHRRVVEEDHAATSLTR
jgi:hypothetical protein